MTRKKRIRTDDISGIVLLMLRNARLICLPERMILNSVESLGFLDRKWLMFTLFTFRDVDDEKRPERSAPPHGVDAALHHAGVDADVDEGEAQDDEDHDVLGVPPEHGLLAEQELMGQSEHEESQTENLYEDLKMSTFTKIVFPFQSAP